MNDATQRLLSGSSQAPRRSLMKNDVVMKMNETAYNLLRRPLPILDKQARE